MPLPHGFNFIFLIFFKFLEREREQGAMGGVHQSDNQQPESKHMPPSSSHLNLFFRKQFDASNVNEQLKDKPENTDQQPGKIWPLLLLVVAHTQIPRFFFFVFKGKKQIERTELVQINRKIFILIFINLFLQRNKLPLHS